MIEDRTSTNICCKILVVISLLGLSACSNVPNEPAYQPSTSTLPQNQQTFADYAQSTRLWLSQNRAFLSKDNAAEINANAPYELLPKVKLGKTRGILLVHGLLDSPFSFVDIAPMLASMGFQVRTLLLEGHGSKPADLLETDHKHWQTLVAQQVAIFKREVGELYLGGFSTGGNLVTSYALKDSDIAGLVLFSPGFKANSGADLLIPLVSLVRDWVFTPSLKNATNYVRYPIGPSNAFAQFYYTSTDVIDSLEEHNYDKPVFMALSESDSVLDVNLILNLFSTRMTNPANRLIWYGQKPVTMDPRVLTFAGNVPAYKVSNFSHMGLLFDSENPYYGTEGLQRICTNGQTNEAYWQCAKRQEVWYSAYGYQEADKAHARLTFNPWFDEMREIIRQVVFTQ